jgi:hypothetical protein
VFSNGAQVTSLFDKVFVWCEDWWHWRQEQGIGIGHSYTIIQEWVMDLNTGCESIAFRINGHTYAVESICPLTGKKEQVIWAGFDDLLVSIKG